MHVALTEALARRQIEEVLGTATAETVSLRPTITFDGGRDRIFMAIAANDLGVKAQAKLFALKRTNLVRADRFLRPIAKKSAAA